MSPKIIDLQPNRSLLNTNFNGYKLSLENIPTSKQELEIPVDRALPKTDEYSFLHAKLYGLHNHLTAETAQETDILYFVNKSWYIQKVTVDVHDGILDEIVNVWKVPKQWERNFGDYNITLKFATNDLAVVGDGMGRLYILDTGYRLDMNSSWRSVFSEEVLGSKKPFIILDVKYNNQELHCLLYSIAQEDANKQPLSSLYWITLKNSDVDQSWGQTALREMQAKGDVYYSYIEPTCQAIYVASDNSFTFVTDSENPIVNSYTWNQTSEKINIKLKLPNDFDRLSLNINSNSKEICINYKDTELLKCLLFRPVDHDLMTWDVENGDLNVILHKATKEEIWSSLCLPQNEVCNNEAAPPTGLTFSTQQTDECDFEEDKNVLFERLSCNSHEVTHKALINSHKILLTVKLSDYPPAFALRHDVDACLWQPCYVNSEFSIKHEGTLDAFAYVQASKQQRKFTECAPDLSYAVICESSRHIFIYRQQKAVTSGELRNRSTGRRVNTVAEQQVITLTNDEILGIYTTEHHLFLLTVNCLYHLKMQ